MVLHPAQDAKARKAVPKAKSRVISSSSYSNSNSTSSGHVIIGSRHQKLLPKERIPIPNTHSRKHQSHRPSPPQPPMEDVMMLMGTTTKNNNNNNNSSMINIPITTPACPTWKLYENPFYTTPHHHNQNHHHPRQQKLQYCELDNRHIQKQIHRLHLPVTAKKLAASFWDLTFVTDDRPSYTESELETTHAQIEKLKAELEHECKARKRMESLNKRLARQLSEEMRSREALERVCQELAKDVSFDRAQISRMKKEMEDERRMLRTAEVIREERVQMKLTEAKILLEEKIEQLDQMAKKMGTEPSPSSSSSSLLSSTSNVKKEEKIVNIQEESVNPISSDQSLQRRVSTEAENPHIKRGIKGFVEFPRVVRAIGCRTGKRLGSKLECQNAQLKTLLKQKRPVRHSTHSGLIAS